MAAPLVVGLFFAVALTGCSGSSSSPGAADGASRTPSSPSAWPSIDPAGLRVLARAERGLAGTHSYSFTADTTLAASSTLRTQLTGRVVRGQGLAYVLAVRGKRTQVVRLQHATYVRVVPGRWSRLAHPRTLVNPTLTLLAVLRSLAPTDVSPDRRVVHGTLGPAAAHAAGLPEGARTADVTVTVDRAGHVIDAVIATSVVASGHTVRVRLHTTYGSFDHVARIRTPV